MRQHGLCDRLSQTTRQVKFGNGETDLVSETLVQGKLRLNRLYGERLDFSVARLDIVYDVILGKPWLYAQNPDVNWRRDHLSFDYMEKPST